LFFLYHLILDFFSFVKSVKHQRITGEPAHDTYTLRSLSSSMANDRNIFLADHKDEQARLSAAENPEPAPNRAAKEAIQPLDLDTRLHTVSCCDSDFLFPWLSCLL
jgi:hypothetical protein